MPLVIQFLERSGKRLGEVLSLLDNETGKSPDHDDRAVLASIASMVSR